MINQKIAVFFDCENISYKYLGEIFDELAKIGEVCINKAYHDWSDESSKEWKEKSSEYAIEPITIFRSTSGKNSADIKIAIDVINTTYKSNIDIIVLVSSDSDFTNLAIDIKSKGIISIGFGEEKTPNNLRKAFSEFYELPRLKQKQKQKQKPINILKEAIKNTINDDGFANVALISQYLKNKDSSLNPQNYGYERWSDIFKEETKYFITDYRNDKSMLVVKIKD